MVHTKSAPKGKHSMSVTYRVEVFESERASWADALGRAVQNELARVGLHRSLHVDLVNGHTPPDRAPCVAVALLGANSPRDAVLRADIEAAATDGLVVIPVVDDLGTFGSQAPAEVARFNGFEWSGSNPARRLASLLLDELGIEDAERRVFLSHRRSDGLGAAEQLHDHLTHIRFKPFIDRFAIPAGGDVQGTIADVLEDFAFLVLLETPEAHESEWVFDEVAYALAHTMGVLIIQWPHDPHPIPGSADLPRLTLDPSELVIDAHGYEVLADSAIDRVLEAVEAAHANALVRRRRMLLLSAQEAAEATGATCLPLTNWRLDVSGSRGRSIVAVSPRLPEATDLQRLDEARTQVDPSAEALLLHAVRRFPPGRDAHLKWVVEGRNLTMVPDNQIGGHW
jgi:hypothetical protein